MSGVIMTQTAGMLTTIQDSGRRGYRHIGVPTGGAMDEFAAEVANILVANPVNAGVVEWTMKGPILQFAEKAVIALCGADGDATVNGYAVPCWRTIYVPAGGVLKIRWAKGGMRGYIAVSGGIQGDRVLGSMATELRAGFGGMGGQPLRDEDRLAVGHPGSKSQAMIEQMSRDCAGLEPVIAKQFVSSFIMPGYRDRPALRVMPGSEYDELSADSKARLFDESWYVSAQSDRMGIRLKHPLGLSLRQQTGKLLSHGVMPGTVQLPPDGQPILLAADSQTTGGYAKVAHVARIDHPLIAQLRPGDALVFRPISMHEAHDLWAARRRDLACLNVGKL